MDLISRLRVVFLVMLLLIGFSGYSGFANAQQASIGDYKNLRGLDSPKRIPGSFIVVLKEDGVREHMLAKRSADKKAAVTEISQEFAFLNGGRVGHVYERALTGFSISGIDDRTADQISRHPAVAFVDTDKQHEAQVTQTPATWGIDRIDQRSLPLSNSYTYINTGSGVHVYVVDSGIRADHGEFTGRIGTGYTAIIDGIGTGDCSGHGTHVAGTIGGTVYGVAKGVTLHPVRVLNCAGAGSSATVIAGLNWVLTNAVAPAVVNYSIGIDAIDTSVETPIANLLAANITVVAAAGNFGNDACVNSPARLGGSSDMLTVGNSNNADARNPGSNWGRCLTLFAPGTNITSAGIASTSATMIYSGTSMSSPHVAGAAAQYLQTNTTATPAAVKAAIVYASTRGAISNTGSSPNRLLYIGFGSSGGSDPAFTTVPPAPTGLQAFCVGHDWDLSWAGSGDVGMYQLYRDNSSSFSSQILEFRTINQNITFTLPTGLKHWRVRACNGAGCGGYSNVITTNYVPNTLCE
jgi:subtilisin family serine protease